MQRSNSDKILLGVCGGIGKQFGIHPVIPRLAFACAFAFFGTGLLIYLIFAVAMQPED